METRWTDDQRQVIDLHERNLLVSAAAGSGKTAVLVERIIQMIVDREHPADIDRLLVVTFTKAAAAQMRERIGRAIEEALKKDPDNHHLQAQSALLPNAQISTFHSFCLSVIRNHFYEIGVDPGFRIGDEREIAMLKEEVLDDVMEEFYETSRQALQVDGIPGGDPLPCRAETGGDASPMKEERQRASDFRFLIESYGNAKSDKNICEMVQCIDRYADSYPWPARWLSDCLSLYECSSAEEMCDQPWMKELLVFLGETVQDLIREEERLLAITMEGDGPQLYGETIRSDLTALERLTGLSSYEEWYEALSGFQFARLNGKRQSGDPAKRQYVKDCRNAVKKRLETLRKNYVFSSADAQFALLEEERPAVRALISLTLRFRERFAEVKENRAFIDFSDIEHFALRILVEEETGRPTAVAKEYQEQYLEIMVDEYQDSNFVQEELLKAVSRQQDGQNNLFMVGDVKQSIYRFRLARPENFVEKYNSYTKEESKNQRIDLQMNFRSRPQVLDFTNEIFYHCMDRDLGNIAYDEDAALYAGAVFAGEENALAEALNRESSEMKPEEQPAPATAGSEKSEAAGSEKSAAEGSKESKDPADPFVPEILLIRPDSGDDIQKKIETEARAAACKIRAMTSPAENRRNRSAENREKISGGIPKETPKEDHMKSSGVDAGVLKPSGFWEFRDIVILVPVTKGWSEIFMRVFSEEGVPLLAESKTGYFSTVEVQIIIQLLKVLNNPRQDLALAGVMRSPIGGFTDEELARIRLAAPEQPFYEAVFRYGENDSLSENGSGETKDFGPGDPDRAQRETADPKLHGKVSRFLKLLEHFRAQAADTPVHELIQNIYRETGILDYVTAWPGGERRRANLEMFLELAVSYEQTSYRGLFDFTRYIEQMHKTEQDYGEAETVSEQENAVRLMTIHRSKGLEFPVVFLCGMGKQFNLMSLRDPILFHPKYGAGLMYKDAKKGIRRKFLPREIFGLLEKREMLGEELRLLYVALTRAKEKLILTGILDEKTTYGGRALGEKEKLTFAERFGATCFFDWVMPVVERGNTEAVVSVITPEDLSGVQRAEQISPAVRRARILERLAAHRPDENVLCELDEQMRWQYPYADGRKIKQKVSVSEVKHHLSDLQSPEEELSLYREPEIIPYLPRFANREQEENAGVLFGTAMHRFLACVDFKEMQRLIMRGNFDAFAFAKTQADELAAAKKMSADTRKRIHLRQIGRFLAGDAARRMASAAARGELIRERPFMMSVPAQEIWTDVPEQETVLVQGIVDAFWKEGNRIILLDYKTDAVQRGEELVSRYRVQLELYAQALSRAYEDCEIGDVMMYSFHLAQTIRLK